MSFTIEQVHGYQAGKRYKKLLRFVRMYGNARTRYVELQDEEGHILHWTTNDYTQTFQHFKKKGTYRFTVSYIISYDLSIHISRLTLVP